MPAVSAPAKVLVTGASGFVATNVIKTLLDDGYAVVGTVRSPPKGDYLKDLFKTEKFSYVIVEDIAKADAFDEVVKSGEFDAIEHTASPFHFAADDPDELIGPAVQGTTGILKSALKFGPKVKRVVITSSVSAIIEPKSPDSKTGKAYTFTESDWNNASPKKIEEQGSKAPPGDKYNASKSLAERAAWDFIQENKSDVKFDLVTINPPFIWGPTMHEIKDVSALNTSNFLLRRALLTKPDKGDEKPLPSSSEKESSAFVGNFIDARTVGIAHTRALQKEEAGGNRFIISAGPFCWQDVYDALNEAGVQNIPKGYPGTQKRETFSVQDGSKAARVLGVEYFSIQKTTLDTLNSLKERFPNDI